jgi:dihydrodipicolinate synthase/N-acetylneuraminate lyase
MKETSTDVAQFADLWRPCRRFLGLCRGAWRLRRALRRRGRRTSPSLRCCPSPGRCSLGAAPQRKALAIQHRITPLARAVTTGFGVPGLKAALNLAGYSAGDPRPPLAVLSADSVERIRALLNAAYD